MYKNLWRVMMAGKEEGLEGEKKDDTSALIWGIVIIFVSLLIFIAFSQGLPDDWVGSLPW